MKTDIKKGIEDNLYTEVVSLIEKKTEGDYWDFKKEWNEAKPVDLVHDILCMANSTHHGNKYIIVGVQNDGTVVGIENSKRKTQANVTDLVRKAKFSPAFPSLAVVPIKYKDKNLDVIVIYNTDNIPIVLTDDYGNTKNGNTKNGNTKNGNTKNGNTKNGEAKNGEAKKFVRKNMVYTRANDTNTPIDTGANYWETEAIWKKHFGLDTNIIDKCKALLRDKENWSGKIFGEWPIYHRIFPEFQIRDCQAMGDSYIKSHPLFYFYFRPGSIYRFEIVYHQTRIHYGMYLCLDGAQAMLPYINIAGIYGFKRPYHYIYLIKDDINYLLFELASYFYPNYTENLNFNPIIVFDNVNEKLLFDKYIKENIKSFKNLKKDASARLAISYEKDNKYAHPPMAEDCWRAKKLFYKWKIETSQRRNNNEN
jgi:hypothetical protein